MSEIMAANATEAVEAVAEPEQIGTTEQTAPAASEQAQPASDEQPVRQETETQRVAHRIKDATTKAQDALIARLFGDQGINTLSEWEEAQALEAYKEQAQVDPVAALEAEIERRRANDPDIVAARKIQEDHAVELAAIQLSKQFPDIKTGDDVRELLASDADFRNMVASGVDVVKAYRAANFDRLQEQATQKTQQETIAKLRANAVASPGALSAAADSPLTITDAEFENPSFNRLVKDNAYYTAYMAEMKRRSKG